MPIPETIVQLRTDGRMIQTFASVLQHDPDSLFAELLSDEAVRNKQLVRLEWLVDTFLHDTYLVRLFC